MPLRRALYQGASRWDKEQGNSCAPAPAPGLALIFAVCGLCGLWYRKVLRRPTLRQAPRRRYLPRPPQRRQSLQRRRRPRRRRSQERPRIHPPFREGSSIVRRRSFHQRARRWSKKRWKLAGCVTSRTPPGSVRCALARTRSSERRLIGLGRAHACDVLISEYACRRQWQPIQAPASASHGPREQSDNKAREYANVSGTQKHAQPAGGAFGNLSLFTAGLRPGAGDLRSQQGPDTSARAPAGFDGIIPWLTGTAGASQRDTGALGNGERGRVMSFSTPTSPASPGTKPLKPILKIPARSPSVPIDSNTLLSHVGGFLFQESNQGNPGSARSRVTWNHVNGTCSLLDGDRDIKTSQVPAFKTAVVFCRVHTETKRCAETHGT